MMNSRPTRKPEGRGPFLKLRRMIAGVAASKPFLITVSALAAIVCWSALVASDGTLTRQKVFANVAVSVTGVAGPDRDERGNPVGTVFIGFSSAEETIAERFDFGAKSRAEIREEAADEAFKLLEEKLKE